MTIVCQTREKAQQVQPVQHELEREDLSEEVQQVKSVQHQLEAEDLAKEVQRVHPVLDAGDQVLAAEAQRVHPVLDAGHQALAAEEVQHLPSIQQDLVAEESGLATEQVQCVTIIQQVMVVEDRALASQDQCVKTVQEVLVAGQVQGTAQEHGQHDDRAHQYADCHEASQPHSTPVSAQQHSIPIQAQSHSYLVHNPAQPQVQVHNLDHSEAQERDNNVENLDVDNQGSELVGGGATVQDGAGVSHGGDKEPKTWKSMKRIGLILRGLAETVQTRVGMMLTVMLMIAVMMQNTWTVGNSHTGC